MNLKSLILMSFLGVGGREKWCSFVMWSRTIGGTSLDEKWGIGLFPWCGVTFLADIDDITYTLQGFANETIRGFEYLSNIQRSHRLTLVKYDIALEYILAKKGGLSVALKLTGDALIYFGS